jgi:hypothetical protein
MCDAEDTNKDSGAYRCSKNRLREKNINQYKKDLQNQP